MSFTSNVWKACFVLMAMGGLVGCEIGPPPTPPGDVARLRLVHAAPLAQAVDVYRVGIEDPIVEGLNLGEASPHLELPAGEVVLAVRPAGQDRTAPPAFLTPGIALQGGQMYTAIATGRLGAPPGPEQFQLLLFQEAFGEVPADNVLVRLVHASPDAPAVGVDLGADDPTAPEVMRLDPFTATEQTGIALPANQMPRVGITANGAHLTTFTLPPLPAGARVFIIAMGQTAALARTREGFALLPVTEDGALPIIRQDPIVFALHASPNAPAVDAFIGPTQLADNLSYGRISPAIRLSPGAPAIDLFAYVPGATRPDTAPMATLTTPQLMAGERYLAIVSGFVSPPAGAQPLQLFAFREAFAVDPNAAHLRAVHASPDAPALDMGPMSGDIVTPLPGWTNLAYGSATAEEGTLVPAGRLTVGVAPAGQARPIERFALDLAPGQLSFVIAAGSMTQVAPTVRPFGLFQVRTDIFPWTAAPSAPVVPLRMP